MPITAYKQNELWNKKATIYLLRNDGISMRRLSSLLGCARDTLRKFMLSPQYLTFLSLIDNDQSVEEVIKRYPEIDILELMNVNNLSIHQIVSEYCNRTS